MEYLLRGSRDWQRKRSEKGNSGTAQSLGTRKSQPLQTRWKRIGQVSQLHRKIPRPSVLIVRRGRGKSHPKGLLKELNPPAESGLQDGRGRSKEEQVTIEGEKEEGRRGRKDES